MSKVYLLFAFVLFHGWGLCQTTVSLPIDFEGGTVENANFGNFDRGTATVMMNPVSDGINTSLRPASLRYRFQLVEKYITPTFRLTFCWF